MSKTGIDGRNLGHIDGDMVITRCRREKMSFLQDTDVEAIAADPRTRSTLVLVRCGGGRFVVSADQAQHFIGIVERDAAAQAYLKRKGPEGPQAGPPSDYIRDVSLPSVEWLKAIGGAR